MPRYFVTTVAHARSLGLEDTDALNPPDVTVYANAYIVVRREDDSSVTFLGDDSGEPKDRYARRNYRYLIDELNRLAALLDRATPILAVIDAGGEVMPPEDFGLWHAYLEGRRACYGETPEEACRKALAAREAAS